MKIRKIRIDGYKNLLDTSIEFNDISALIALNNYGKSNFLEAIDFGNLFIQNTEKGKRAQMRYENVIPINNHTEYNNFLFELELEGKFYDKQTIIYYSLSFEWIKENNKGAKIVGEKLRFKTEEDSKPTTYINRNSKTKYYKSSVTGRCDKSIKINDNYLIINKLKNFDDLYYINIINALNELNFNFITLNNVDKYFTPQSVAMIDANSGSINTKEIKNTAKFFYILQEENEDKYNLLMDLILDLLPNIEYIKPIQIDFKTGFKSNKYIPFQVPEKIYDIRVKVKTNNQETSINSLSEGSKRIVHILSEALIADYSNIQLICFEELENSIHPALLQRLLVIITELTDNTQILITSHSPHLVKYLDLESIYLGIPNINGTAYFKKIKKSKRAKLMSYAKDSESNLGDFVFDMLVEGFEDESFWNEFI